MVLTMMLALLVITVGSVLEVQREATSRAVKDLGDQIFRVTALATATRMSAIFQTAAPVLTDARNRALFGQLDVDDRDAIADLATQRVTVFDQIDRMYFGDAHSGRFVIASRSRADASTVLGMSEPELNGGRRDEWRIGTDGAREPLLRDAVVGYDPRQRDWYQLASGSNRTIWTEPYAFPDGVRGITAALALRDQPGGAVRGVFGMDFRLTELSNTLSAFGQGRSHVSGATYIVLTRAGIPLASSVSPDDIIGQSAVKPAMDGLIPRAGTQPVDEISDLRFEVDGAEWLGSVSAHRVTDEFEYVLLGLIPEDQLLGAVTDGLRRATMVGLGILTLALLVGWYVSRQITGSLSAVTSNLARIARFDMSDDQPPRCFIREIDTVSVATGRMKASLRSFSRYVPLELVRELVVSGEEARLGGEFRPVTIFFSDIEGFTRISESVSPDVLVEHLGIYLQTMTATLHEHQGSVDKFIGDGILAMFNAPLPLHDHAAAACRAALAAHARVQRLNKAWTESGQPVLRTRIGLHTGQAIIGNIGTPERFDYTVIGDVVNLASRLEGLNKVYRTFILASEHVVQATEDAFEWRSLDRVAVVGRTSWTGVYELLGEQGSVDPDLLTARDRYEEGFSAYVSREFSQAAELFGEALVKRPSDSAADKLRCRALELARDPPAADWDGVYQATAK